MPNSLYCALAVENEANRIAKKLYIFKRIDMNSMGTEVN